MRPVTLFTGQWADMPIAELAPKAASWGYDGLELATWGDHMDIHRVLDEDGYAESQTQLLADNGLSLYAISCPLVGQAVADAMIDGRHKAIVPTHVWGDGEPEGVRQRGRWQPESILKRVERNGGKPAADGTAGFALQIEQSGPVERFEGHE